MDNKQLQKLLLAAYFIEDFFVSLGYPAFYRAVMPLITERILATGTLLSCLSGIIICKIWNKYSNKLINKYTFFNIFELTLNIIMVAITLATKNYFMYYIMDMIVASFITRQIICAHVKIKSILLLGKERELFDNNSSVTSNFAILIGSAIALVLGPSLHIDIALIILLISLISGNIFYLIVFVKFKPQINENIRLEQQEGSN